MNARYVITLTDPDQKEFLEQLLAKFDFIKVEDDPSQTTAPLNSKEKQVQVDLRDALKEVREDRTGKKKLSKARDFINELRG